MKRLLHCICLLQLNQHSSSALLTVPLFRLKHLFLLTSIHPKKFFLLLHSPGELLTSVLPLGLPLLQTLALFQATLFHLNFNPIYSLSFPLARLGLSTYSSSGLHDTRPCHKSLC